MNKLAWRWMKGGKSKWNRLLRGLLLDLQSPVASDSMVDWWLRVRLEHNIDIRKGFDSLVLPHRVVYLARTQPNSVLWPVEAASAVVGGHLR